MSAIIKYYRHGETEWNKEGRLQGWQNSRLTNEGIQQASEVCWVPDLVFCSDLLRAKHTAKLMFPNSDIIESAALREIHLGHWQGQFIKKLEQEADYVCYTESPEAFVPTTQETFAQVTARMVRFYEELQKLPEKKIAVVSHGVAIACLTTALKQRPLHELWQYMLPGCGSIRFSMEVDDTKLSRDTIFVEM